MTDQPTLHARLTREIEDHIAGYDMGDQIGHGYHALRAVVELHHEEPCENAIHDNHPQAGWCIGCDPEHEDSCASNPWPCPTVRTIARELGITAEVVHRG